MVIRGSFLVEFFGEVHEMRGVKYRTLVDAGRGFLSIRDLLSGTFQYVPENAVGAPYLIVGGLGTEVLEVLRGGIFEYLTILEGIERNALTLSTRPGENELHRDDSKRVLGASLAGETPTEVAKRIVISLVDLSFLTRTVYRSACLTGGEMRRYLWSQYRIVDRAFLEHGRNAFMTFVPNARTGRRIPEQVLRATAEAIVHEREVLPGYVKRVRHSSFGTDALVGLRRQPLLDLLGRSGPFDREVVVTDVMNILANPHSRVRRGFLATMISHVTWLNRMDFQARIRLSRGERDPAIKLAADVCEVQLHMLVRALEGFFPEEN